VLALSTLAGIGTLWAMHAGTPHRGRSSALARAGAVLALIIHFLPLAAALPPSGRGAAVDRAPGIVLARHRQALADAPADDRPLPPRSAAALPPACMPAVRAPGPTGCSRVDVWDERASPSLPGSPSRSPPAA
jgi:hypothetical protein